MPRRPLQGPVGGQQTQTKTVRRRVRGELSTGDFTRGVLETVLTLLSGEMKHLEARHQGSLVKVFAPQEPAIHFELWVHHSSGRVELGLHFETRDATRNERLLEFVADELPFLKHALGESVEAEPWDKGWTRLYLTRPIDRLSVETQQVLAQQFAEFIATVEPIRQDAVAECAAD